ncbi:MAG TPA: alkaline phosphatase family protein [Halanaerobiales bacterium]|nr:alkaline phosphatase family protein [Halanaerobiales bacterium]
MSGRTFVIGIDGGDFSLVNKWIKEGKLPNLEKIKKAGSSGKLRSTIPPITGAAWSTFQTGTNPGKHGAFNWFKRKEGEYRASPVTYNDIAEPTLWQILSKQDKKVGIIGVPVTYPPEKINGFLVPGLLTPKEAKNQSYPKDIIDEVREIAPDYKFSPKEWTRGYDPKEWVEEMHDDIDDKVNVATHFMDTKEWDMMMVHFMETDQVQHFMWNYHEDENHEWDPVFDIYKKADEAIGKISEKLNEDDTLLIMSDHGFGPLRYDFHIDTWLLREGYIKFRDNPATKFKKFFFNRGVNKESLYPIGEYLYPVANKINFINNVLDVASNPLFEWLFLSSQNVDWENTVAYSHSEIGHIYLNVKGREPRGCVEPEDVPEVRQEIIEKLRNLENPFTGKKITSQVYEGDKYYHGDKAHLAPDIIFLPDDMEIIGKGAYEFLTHKTVNKSRFQTGHHRMDGLFFAAGPHVQENNDVDAGIIDLAPTILYDLGLPVLDSMDGDVIATAFKHEYKMEQKLEMTSKDELDLNIKKDGNDDDDEEMRERLKGLGYVS